VLLGEYNDEHDTQGSDHHGDLMSEYENRDDHQHERAATAPSQAVVVCIKARC